MLTPSHGRREGYRNLDLDGMDVRTHTLASRRGYPPPGATRRVPSETFKSLLTWLPSKSPVGRDRLFVATKNSPRRVAIAMAKSSKASERPVD